MKISLAMLASLALATHMHAQVPVIPAPPVVVESLPAFDPPNGALLRPGLLTYVLTLTKPDGSLAPLGTRTVTVSDATLGGMAGWLIADARQGTAVETTDSVYVQRGDLAPERWMATIGRAQLGTTFTRDTMFGAVDSYRGRSSFTLAVPRGAMLSAGMTERVIELLPLRAGYRAGAVVMLLGGERPRVERAEIAVEREERIQIGNRDVQCWLVALRSEALEQRLWVSRDVARVVRTEQAVPGGVLTSVLLP